MTIAVESTMVPITRNIIVDAREVSVSLSHQSTSLRKCASVSSALSSMIFGDKSNSGHLTSCSDTVQTSIGSIDLQDSRDYAGGYEISNNNLVQLIQERRWNKLESLLNEEPALARSRLSYEMTDKNGMKELLHAVMPLHILCALRGVPLLAIRAALNANPSAAQLPDPCKGMLPVHLACQNPFIPVSAIEQLIKVHPNGLKMKTKNGNLPLHLAVRDSCSSSVIELLLSSFPQATRSENASGNLPLHNACSRSSLDNSMFRQVLKAYPEAAAKKNKNDQMPLHIACSWRNPTYVIAALVHEYPKASQMKDANDDLPVDLLTISGSNSSCEYSLPSDPRFHILKSAETSANCNPANDKVNNENVSHEKARDKMNRCKTKSLKKKMMTRVHTILAPHVSSNSLKLT